MGSGGWEGGGEVTGTYRATHVGPRAGRGRDWTGRRGGEEEGSRPHRSRATRADGRPAQRPRLY